MESGVGFWAFAVELQSLNWLVEDALITQENLSKLLPSRCRSIRLCLKLESPCVQSSDTTC